jgi:exopolysaccharide biosynthesis polyprenyl glycosylphosphotransferase
MNSASPNVTDRAAIAGVDRSRPRSRPALGLREAELGFFLLVADLGAAAIASYGTPLLWSVWDREFVPTAGLSAWQLAFPVLWAMLLRLFGAGDIVTPRFGRRSIASVAQTYFVATTVVLGLFFFVPFFIPRGSSLATTAVAAIVTLSLRLIFLRVTSVTLLERRVVVLGTDVAARRAAAVLASSTTLRYRLICFFDGGSPAHEDHFGIPVRPLPSDLWTSLSELEVDLVVVGHTRTMPQEVLAELVRCFEGGIEAVPATMLYEQLSGRVLVSALEADWYADLPTSQRSIYGAFKRAYDAVFAATSLIVLSPLFGLIALAVALDSRGPILLHQRRVGRRGQSFTCHKFRSMTSDAEPDGEPVWASPDDPRRTRVGRILRRSRLDELPQLWNVVRGHMSLIGPRPERPEFVDRLAGELPLYRARLLVRPGVTGWAQVMYPYAGSIEENLAKLEYDLYYIRHFGPLLDLSILLRTVSIVLGLSKPEFTEGSRPPRS